MNSTRFFARTAAAILPLLFLASVAFAQDPYPGQNLVSPMNSFNSYLIELDGTVTQTWHGAQEPASIAYLLDDGSILRPCKDLSGHFQGGGSGGRIQRIDADDVVVWDYFFSTAEYQQHHDIQPLPNGNVLLIAWEAKTAQEASDMGRQNIYSEMWPTLIVEVEPLGATGGNIVWEWHLWDHLIQDVDPAKPNYGVVADHPELVDINFGNVGGGPHGGGDWIHANAIDYHPELDQIVFSSRTFNEVYVIDHSTTTEEAAGHTGGNSGMGGDILYRWGNPQAYGRGTSGDQYYYVVHGVNWIDAGLPGAGNILTFNNGDRPGSGSDYSTVDEIVPPVDEFGNYSIDPGAPFGPAAPAWIYGGPGGFYGSPTQCGAYRMPNGNTVVCVSTGGYLFEVTDSGEIVWEYNHPGGNVARAERYWDGTTGVSGNPPLPDAPTLHSIAPNPFNPATEITFSVPVPGRVTLDIFDAAGRLVVTLVDENVAAGRHRAEWDGRDRQERPLASGTYLARLRTGQGLATAKLLLAK